MIKTRKDLEYYIQEDRRVYGRKMQRSWRQSISNKLFPNNNIRYLWCLRHLEYHANNKGLLHYLGMLYWERRRARLQALTGIELYANCAGPGIFLPHGKVVVSGGAKLGRNCKLNSDVTIGEQGRLHHHGNALIGDNVYIGTGARIIGDVRIADGVVIGANAVVTKDILEPNTTWAGSPAKKMTDKGSEDFILQ